MSVDLHHVVDLICLVYHEARNVRHPIKAGKLVNASRYVKLLNLPTNRNDAWRRMRTLRECAVGLGTIGAATETFQRFFDLSLAELGELYAMSIWRSSAYGGNKWVDITARVCDLIDAMNASGARAQEVYREISSMYRNTGCVADKLQNLRAL